MKNINTILSVIFVVLLLPCFIKYNGSMRALDLTDESLKVFPGFRAETVASIQITRPKKLDDPAKAAANPNPQVDGISFVRNEEKWLIASGDYQGIEARSSEIDDRILKRLNDMIATKGTIIQSDPSDSELASYKLDEASATRVVCGDNAQKPIVQLLVGRNAGDQKLGKQATTGTFVRPVGQKVVILYDRELDLDLDPTSWMEKKLQDVAEADIKALSLRNEKGTISFTRQEGKGWKCDKPPADVGKLKEFELNSLIGRARTVEAAGFKSRLVARQQLTDFGLGDDAPIEIKLTTKADKVHLLHVGKKVEGKQEFYAWLAGKPLIFKLAEWNVTPLQKDPKDFFDPKPITPPKDNSSKKGGDEKGQKKDGVKPPSDTNKDQGKDADAKNAGATKQPTKSDKPPEKGEGKK